MNRSESWRAAGVVAQEVRFQSYLEANPANLARVKENPDKIEAIQIILKRPKDWRTDVLDELRKKLGQHDFSEDNLQKAHKVVYEKALADIISMIKHATKRQAPLLTAEERVDRAIAHVTKGKTFDKRQQQWLGLIREHLVTNLTIELDHFDYVPIFERKGGLGKARQIFKDEFETLLVELNYALAA